MADPGPENSVMTAITTEHFALQSAASTTVAEAGNRASLYLVSLSSFLVATGFVAQVPDALAPFLGAVMPTIFLLGIFTTVRLVDTGVENIQFLAAISSIRRYYRDLAGDRPEAALFQQWEAPAGDIDQALAVMAVSRGVSAEFFTTASMIATINSVVAGAGIALLAVSLLDKGSAAVGILLGVAVALALELAFLVYQHHRYQTMKARMESTGHGQGT
jgi:hypothetical protein